MQWRGRRLGWVPLVLGAKHGEVTLPSAVTYLEEEAKQPNVRTRMSAPLSLNARRKSLCVD